MHDQFGNVCITAPADYTVDALSRAVWLLNSIAALVLRAYDKPDFLYKLRLF